MSKYWNQTLIGRRTALRIASAGGAIVALSLVGCGGGSSREAKPSGGPVEAFTDSTKGKPGGVFKWGNAGPMGPSFSIMGVLLGYTINGLSHSALLGMKWGQDSVDLYDYSVEPDLAQALPEQPDEVTQIFKLRPGVKFHNGKPLTAEDVRYSLDRYTNADSSVFRVRFRNWLDKVETPDAQTIVVKDKFPYADALLVMSGNQDGFVMSKEFEESVDSNNKHMGSGPFIWVEGSPPAFVKWRKNPDYYLKPYPYFDEIHAIGYLDPTKRQADFVSGQIQMPWLVYAEERDQIKKQKPDARLQGWESWENSIVLRTDKAPFNDKRVRQALSMAFDRKKIRDVATKGEGRDDQYFPLMYKQVLGSREVKDLGSGAQYWQYNPAEAKKLLSAAGVTLPIETQMTHWQNNVVGQWFVDSAVTLQAQWRELGIANVKDIEQQNQLFQSTTQQGQYEGTVFFITTGINSNAPSFAQAVRDSLYWGPNGEHSPSNLGYINDSRLSALAEKQIRQLKSDDRKATYREIEPIMAEEQYRIVLSTTTQNYLFDPTLKNARMSIEQGSRRFMMRWWYDKG